MEVYFSQKALRSLSQIYHYIAVENHSPENAEKLIADIQEQVLSHLCHTPRLGRKLSDNENIRFIVVRKHTIVYKIHKRHITVSDIFSAGQNWRKS